MMKKMMKKMMVLMLMMVGFAAAFAAPAKVSNEEVLRPMIAAYIAHEEAPIDIYIEKKLVDEMIKKFSDDFPSTYTSQIKANSSVLGGKVYIAINKDGKITFEAFNFACGDTKYLYEKFVCSNIDDLGNNKIESYEAKPIEMEEFCAEMIKDRKGYIKY